MIDSELPRKLLSIEQANARLPLVRKIAADLVAQHDLVTSLKERLSRIRRRKKSDRKSDALYDDELEQFEGELEAAKARLDAFVGELSDLGLEIVDPVRGAISFPALIEGREARLSWQPGEEEVGWWHEVGEGLHARRSLLAESAGGDDPKSDDWQS
jgi:hypothetical protein